MRVLILTVIFILVGCIAAPERKPAEPDSCFDYRYCMYLAAKGVQTDCKAEYLKCCKDRDYETCKKEYPEDFKDFVNCFNARQ